MICYLIVSHGTSILPDGKIKDLKYFVIVHNCELYWKKNSYNIFFIFLTSFLFISSIFEGSQPDKIVIKVIFYLASRNNLKTVLNAKKLDIWKYQHFFGVLKHNHPLKRNHHKEEHSTFTTRFTFKEFFVKFRKDFPQFSIFD